MTRGPCNARFLIVSLCSVTFQLLGNCSTFRQKYYTYMYCLFAFCFKKLLIIKGPFDGRKSLGAKSKVRHCVPIFCILDNVLIILLYLLCMIVCL